MNENANRHAVGESQTIVNNRKSLEKVVEMF